MHMKIQNQNRRLKMQFVKAQWKRLSFKQWAEHGNVSANKKIHTNAYIKTNLPIRFCLDSTHSKNICTCKHCGNASVQPWLGKWEGQTERLKQSANLAWRAATYNYIIAAATSGVCVVVIAIIVVVINTICILCFLIDMILFYEAHNAFENQKIR